MLVYASAQDIFVFSLLQSPVDAPELQVCVRQAAVGVASDYSKRRHVVRLVTPGGTQLLLQADSQTAMSAWITNLSAHANMPVSVASFIIQERTGS